MLSRLLSSIIIGEVMNRHITQDKNKSLKKILNKIEPTIEPYGTQDFIV